MDKIFTNPAQEDWSTILQRPAFDSQALEATVSAIIADVKTTGDLAIRKYAVQFDGVDPGDFKVSEAEIAAAVSLVSEELKTAIQLAKSNIEKFHSAQLQQSEKVETTAGVLCWR